MVVLSLREFMLGLAEEIVDPRRRRPPPYTWST